MRPELGRGDYIRLLERFYGFYEPWEESMRSSDWLDGRRKTPLLAADLAFFGRHPAALPRCSELPRAANAAETVGVMYVLEGSTLGGQLLSRHFERLLSVRPGAGGTFFAGYGAGTGSMWRAFCERAERDGDALESVGPALQTFDILHGWLTA